MKTTKRSRRAGLLAATALCAAAIMFGASAAPAGAAEGSMGEPWREGCTIFVPVTVDTTGTYRLEVWDDGEMTDELSLEIAAGETGVFAHVLTQNVGGVNTGLGFSVDGPSGEYIDGIDPWDFEGSATIMEHCAESGGTDDGSGTTTTTVPEEDGEPSTTVAGDNEPTTTVAPQADDATAARPVTGAPTYTG